MSLIQKLPKKEKKRIQKSEDENQTKGFGYYYVSGTDWILRAPQFPETVLFPLASSFIPSETSAPWSKPTKNNMTLRLTNKEMDHGIPMKYSIK